MERNGEVKKPERRTHPRIAWNFMVRFKLHGEQEGWNVSVIKDISLGGCYFYSNVAYKVSQVLDTEIKFPSLIEPMRFTGEVRRYDHHKQGMIDIYGIAIKFVEMDKVKWDKFIETMTFFLNKLSKSKS